jgi:RNA polymerase sigma-70 factor, ECF subfamily
MPAMGIKPALVEATVERGARPAAACSDAELAALRQRLDGALRRICPPWLVGQRDDILQDAMVRVIRVLDRTGDAEVSGAYLARVGYTAMIDEIRRVRRRREDALDDAAEPAAPAAAGSPERTAASSQVLGGVRDCMARLVESRRRVVTLYLLGHGVGEIAATLDEPYKRIENLVHRGLTNLRDCLARKGISP